MEKRGRRNGCCWWAAAGTVAVFAGLITYLLKPEPSLLDGAARLADAGAWVPGFGSYFWENDRAVLTFRPQLTGVRAVSVQTGSGTETARTTLTNAIAKGGQEVRQWRLSRNGKLLLWRNQVGSTWYLSDLEGKRVKTWANRQGGYGPMWLPEDKGWFESHTSTTPNTVGGGINYFMAFTIHSLEADDRPSTPVPGPFSWPVGITPDHCVVSLQWAARSGSSGGQAEWSTYTIAAKPVCTEHRVAVMPKSASNLVEAELSPDGRHIACLVQYSYISPLEELMGRFLHTTLHPHEKVALWVIRRDGRGMRMLGSEEGGTPFGLLWTPDGKRLSFVDHDTLYAVPAGT